MKPLLVYLFYQYQFTKVSTNPPSFKLEFSGYTKGIKYTPYAIQYYFEKINTFSHKNTEYIYLVKNRTAII